MNRNCLKLLPGIVLLCVLLFTVPVLAAGETGDTYVPPARQYLSAGHEDGKISLWIYPKMNAVDGLEVYRSIDGGGWTKIKDLKAGDFSEEGNKIYDDPVQSGKYQYKYRYYIGGSYGEFSTATDLYFLMPPKITGVSATGREVTVSIVPDTHATGYSFSVYGRYAGRDEDSLVTYFDLDGGSETLRFSIDEYYLTDSESFYFVVHAFNDHTFGGTSTEPFVVFNDLSVRSGPATSSSATELIWKKDPKAGGYYIYRYDKSGKSYKRIAVLKGSDNSRYIDNKVEPEKGYTYSVQAYRKIGGNSFQSVTSDPLRIYTLPTASKIKSAASKKPELKTGKVKTAGSIYNYVNFVDNKGKYNLGYIKGKYLYIKRISPKTLKVIKTLKVRARYPVLGALACDKKGNYYVAWGQNDNTENKTKKTFAISKYSNKGKHIKTISASGGEIDVKQPFRAGGCVMAFDGDILVCHFARLMYMSNDGLNHQACETFAVNTKTMNRQIYSTVIRGREHYYSNYVSHSFAQRIISLKNGGVLYADLGDAYPRGFSLEDSKGFDQVPVHFFGALGQNYTNSILGDIAEVSGGYMLTGASVKSMRSLAGSRQLFVTLSDSGSGKPLLNKIKRTGTSCGEKETDTGIKWLTNYKDGSDVSNVYMVKTEKDRVFIMWERTGGKKKVNGTYYMVLSANGKIIHKARRLRKTGLGYPSEVCYDKGYVYWTTCTESDSGNKMVFTINRLNISKLI